MLKVLFANDARGPLTYCAMTVGGSSMARAASDSLGYAWALAFGVLISLLLLNSLRKDLKRHTPVSFAYLSLLAAMMAYFGILLDIHAESEGQKTAILFFILLACGVVMPIVEAFIVSRQFRKVSGE